MNDLPNIVLVHGAWADGSSWSAVIEHLQGNGYHVTAPQFPMTSLAAEVARLRQVLARQDGPAIVAGHSYGGQIITALGTDAPNAAGLAIGAIPKGHYARWAFGAATRRDTRANWRECWRVGAMMAPQNATQDSPVTCVWGGGVATDRLGGRGERAADGRVVHLRPEEAMVEAMLRGWRAQQTARGLR